jgi:hypothetical protein
LIEIDFIKGEFSLNFFNKFNTMTTKVVLDINEKLAEKAKKYAEEQGQSLSSLVESIFLQITETKAPSSDIPQVGDPELVKRILDGSEPLPEGLEKLFGILKGMTDEELESAKWEYLKEKHGL